LMRGLYVNHMAQKNLCQRCSLFLALPLYHGPVRRDRERANQVLSLARDLGEPRTDPFEELNGHSQLQQMEGKMSTS
jgi:hypothetical protein